MTLDVRSVTHNAASPNGGNFAGTMAYLDFNDAKGP